MDWGPHLVEQLEFYWTAQFRPRLEGLTDDEYFWEPVADCWTIRKGDDGKFMADWEFPPPDPPPVTTIAWRLGHIATGVFGFRVDTHFGPGTLTWDDITWPVTAADAIAWVEDTYSQWITAIKGMDDEALARPIGLHPGKEPPMYADYPFVSLVLHIHREAIHHAAEVALLRDLYRAR